jgi:hypothetical protein
MYISTMKQMSRAYRQKLIKLASGVSKDTAKGTMTRVNRPAPRLCWIDEFGVKH